MHLKLLLLLRVATRHRFQLRSVRFDSLCQARRSYWKVKGEHTLIRHHSVALAPLAVTVDASRPHVTCPISAMARGLVTTLCQALDHERCLFMSLNVTFSAHATPMVTRLVLVRVGRTK